MNIATPIGFPSTGREVQCFGIPQPAIPIVEHVSLQPEVIHLHKQYNFN
jgi:hypothetical protein